MGRVAAAERGRECLSNHWQDHGWERSQASDLVKCVTATSAVGAVADDDDKCDLSAELRMFIFVRSVSDHFGFKCCTKK